MTSCNCDACRADPDSGRDDDDDIAADHEADDRSIYDDLCPSCGEPGLIGCDSSCPEAAEHLRAYMEAEERDGTTMPEELIR